jgi:hypothetical protein
MGAGAASLRIKSIPARKWRAAFYLREGACVLTPTRATTGRRNIDDGSKLDSRAPKAKEVAHAIETLPFDARRGVASRIDADSVCTGPG